MQEDVSNMILLVPHWFFLFLFRSIKLVRGRSNGGKKPVCFLEEKEEDDDDDDDDDVFLVVVCLL